MTDRVVVIRRIQPDTRTAIHLQTFHPMARKALRWVPETDSCQGIMASMSATSLM